MKNPDVRNACAIQPVFLSALFSRNAIKDMG